MADTPDRLKEIRKQVEKEETISSAEAAYLLERLERAEQLKEENRTGWNGALNELERVRADLSATRTRLEEIRKLVERWHHIGHLSYKLGPRTTDLTERLGKHTIVVTGPKFEECDNLFCQALRGEPVGERE